MGQSSWRTDRGIANLVPLDVIQVIAEGNLPCAAVQGRMAQGRMQ